MKTSRRFLLLSLTFGMLGACQHHKSQPVDSVEFTCPTAGCEVATDAEAMAVLVMHQTDTPGDDGAFGSDSRARMYDEAVEAGKILRITDGTHAARVYETPVQPDNSARYCVAKILDGEYAARKVVVQDKYLR